MISFSPSMTCTSSAGLTFPSRGPTRSTANGRIWLILTRDFLGSPFDCSSRVSENPARYGRAFPPQPPESLDYGWRRQRSRPVYQDVSRSIRQERLPLLL